MTKNTQHTCAQISIAMSLLIVACAPDIPPHPYQDSDYLIQEVNAERAFLIDTRKPDEFKEGHIPGAVNMPHSEIERYLDRIPKDRVIVLYCKVGGRSQKALEALKAQGYTKLFNFGGLRDFKRELKKP